MRPLPRLAVFACGFAPPTSEPLHIPAHVLPRADSKRLPDVHAAIQGPVPTLHPDGLAATLQAVIDKHSALSAPAPQTRTP